MATSAKRKQQPTPSSTAEPPAAAPDAFMSRAEAAAFCRLNIQTIDKAMYVDKTLRFYHVGRRVLLQKPDVLRWMQVHEA